jgi:hypothetical protein
MNSGSILRHTVRCVALSLSDFIDAHLSCSIAPISRVVEQFCGFAPVKRSSDTSEKAGHPLPKRHPLYRSYELSVTSGPVLFVEGEKCVELARSLVRRHEVRVVAPILWTEEFRPVAPITDDMARHWLTYYSMSDEEYKAEVAERNRLKSNATNQQQQ